MTPARTWTFQTFKRAQLQGDVSIVVEDGSTTPKTNLGLRAAVEHATSLGMLNMAEPDQQYEGLKLFGLTRMIPTLDIQVQSALQKQQAFETWVQDPRNLQTLIQTVQQQQQVYQTAVQQVQVKQTGLLAQAAANPSAPMPPAMQMPPSPPSMLDTTPLKWQPWYTAAVHLQEFLKWANDDAIRGLLTSAPMTQKLLELHLQEIQAAMPQPVAPVEKPKISFAFTGADLVDAQVRQAFDEAVGEIAPQPGETKPPISAPPSGVNRPPPPQAAGASRAMKNSNDNSAPAGNKAQPEHPPGKVG
jgi:hypothetical protein